MLTVFGKHYKSSGIEFIQEHRREEKISNEYELYYVINGQLFLTVDRAPHHLREGDVFVVNAEQRRTLESSKVGSVFIVKISMSVGLLRESLGYGQFAFECNSSNDTNEIYHKIYEKLDALLKLLLSRDAPNDFQLRSVGFALLNELISSFLVVDATNVDDRLSQITRYIKDNYKEDLSLVDVSGRFFMNPSYFSRYFKKEMGIGFHDFLMDHRLQCAYNELLGSEKNVGYIAIENGFKNVTSFAGYFKKKYGLLPSKVKESSKVQVEPTAAETEQQMTQQQKLMLQKWIVKKAHIGSEDSHEIYADAQLSVLRTDSRLLNLGSADELLQSDYREHILFLKKELPVTHGRLWNLFVEEMNINLTLTDNINFDRIDSVLDFLVENEIIPFIELSHKVKRIHKNVDNAVTVVKSILAYSDIAPEWDRLFQNFMNHIKKRYGLGEIKKWCFELTRDEKGIAEYMRQYKAAYQIIKNISQEIAIGGSGFKINYDSVSFRDELSLFEKNKMQLDFLSLMFFPYQREWLKNQRRSKQIMESDHLKRTVAYVDEIKAETIYSSLPIYITEWGNSISNRNKLNDTTFKGAYILKNLLDVCTKVDRMGYWIATDLFGDFADSTMILNGSAGLVSKNGIPKPSFYALKFYRQLKPNICYQAENFIVTADNEGNFAILIHNYKELNYLYYVNQEDSITYQKIPTLFVNKEPKTIHLRLNHLTHTQWEIKKNSVNNQFGDVLQTWQSLGFRQEVNREEVDYLKRTTIPKLHFENMQGATIELFEELEANEIRLIEITKY